LVRNEKHKALVKKNLDSKGIASQFLVQKNMQKKCDRGSKSRLGVISNIIRQVNAKCGMDLYRLNFHRKTDNTMVVGVDVHNMGTRTIIGMTASYSKH
jgi:hypothetical protein